MSPIRIEGLSIVGVVESFYMSKKEPNKVGRPLKYTAEEFDLKIQEYFKKCIEDKSMATKGGLALYLDMTRDMLLDYSKREEFTNAIKRAYLVIEEDWVQTLRNQSVAGTIFYLKNAFSDLWRDRQEQEHKFDFSDLIKGKNNGV